MTDETESRNARLLREANEEFQKKKAVFKGMAPEEKKVLAILLVVVAVLVAGFVLLFSGRAKAETVIDIDCSKVEGRCDVSLNFLKLMQDSNRKLAEALLLEQKAKNCNAKNMI